MARITHEQYVKLILDHVDFTGCEELITDPDDLVGSLKEVFDAEYGWHVVNSQGKTMGEICKEYLGNLPSPCILPYYNRDVVQWIEAARGEPVPDNEVGWEIENHWKRVGFTLARLFKEHK